jgi:D-alanyl-D-alanine carboxypeptidase (penicillin-binding protein 5/6)
MKLKVCTVFLLLSLLHVTQFMIHDPTVYAVKNDIQLNSEAVILIDSKSGQILYEKNSMKRMFPASITKIVTGILAIESGKLDEMAVTSYDARWIEGTRIYLAEGEEKPLQDIVYGLLMHSGNDAAIVIAEHIAGSVEAFAQRMNAFVWETLGSTNTHFVNPHGLFAENHYTTAYDMAFLAKRAMENQVFREIVATKIMPWDGEAWDSRLVNHNRLLFAYEGAIGIKNGYVDQSGNTLVASAKRGETELLAVLLKANGSKNVYQDATDLLDYGFATYQTNKLLSKGQVIGTPEAEAYYVMEDIFITAHKENEELATWVVDGNDTLTITGPEGSRKLTGVIERIAPPDLSNPQDNEKTKAVQATGGRSQNVIAFSILMLLCITLITSFLSTIIPMNNKQQ